jgi:hypothetical protein
MIGIRLPKAPELSGRVPAVVTSSVMENLFVAYRCLHLGGEVRRNGLDPMVFLCMLRDLPKKMWAL